MSRASAAASSQGVRRCFAAPRSRNTQHIPSVVVLVLAAFRVRIDVSSRLHFLVCACPCDFCQSFMQSGIHYSRLCSDAEPAALTQDGLFPPLLLRRAKKQLAAARGARCSLLLAPYLLLYLFDELLSYPLQTTRYFSKIASY